jgi:hypothetical protein
MAIKRSWDIKHRKPHATNRPIYTEDMTRLVRVDHVVMLSGIAADGTHSGRDIVEFMEPDAAEEYARQILAAAAEARANKAAREVVAAELAKEEAEAEELCAHGSPASECSEIDPCELGMQEDDAWGDLCEESMGLRAPQPEAAEEPEPRTVTLSRTVKLTQRQAQALYNYVMVDGSFLRARTGTVVALIDRGLALGARSGQNPITEDGRAIVRKIQDSPLLSAWARGLGKDDGPRTFTI